MSYDRKANCIILAHEHELAKNVKTKDLIKQFVLSKRKLKLLYIFAFSRTSFVILKNADLKFNSNSNF